MRELEKILEEIEDKKWECINRDYIYGSRDRVNGLDMAIDIIRKHMNDGWIPVDERLPEEKGVYLVTYHPCYWDNVDPEVYVGIDTFRGKTTWAKRKFQRVIAWRPLPEPYQAERSSDNE